MAADIQIGPVLKKWTLLDDMQAQCIEADEDLARVSDYVLHGGDLRSAWEDASPEAIGSTLLVPYEEFRQVLFFLPKFEDLPIFANAWRHAGQPQYFVLRCFDGGRSQEGDEFWVDTEGFDYPRYKAALRRV